MDNQVEDIKRKLDIVNVITKYMPLKKRGRHYFANCPFHGEKTPSFIVSPDLQIFKCFGCGKAGDIFTFVQEYEKIDFREALEEMAKLAGIELVRSAGLSAAESHHKRLIEINTRVAQFYHYVMLNHPLGKSALDYVLSRGITLDTIKLFKIGFSPPRNDSLVKQLIQKGYSVKDLIATGTFGQSNYGGRLYDRFQGRLVFPLCDYRDRILGFSGRILPGADTDQHAKYINSPETDIYHKGQMVYGLNLAKEAIKKEDSVLVVEGEFDMISPYQIGIKNIIALKGTAFTHEQLQLLKRYTNNLVLALDSDFAGNNAAKKSIQLADSLGMEIHVLTLGNKYKDPDEAVKADPDYFRSRLSATIPVWDFLIRSAVQLYGTDTNLGKKQIMNMVLPFLVKIENAVIRTDYFRKLAAELGTTQEALTSESVRHQTDDKSSPAIPSTSLASTSIREWAENSGKQEKLEEFLLVLIFGGRQPQAIIQKLTDKIDLITIPKFKNILTQLMSLTEFDPQAFAKTLPAELQTVFQNIYLTATTTEIESTKRPLEIQKVLNHLEVIYLKKQLKELSTRIAQVEDQADSQTIAAIESDYNHLLQKLSKLQTQK